MSSATRVSLEIGRSWVFAAALDWPGWCRRGKGEDAALEVLSDYADRYACVVGPDFAPGTFEVVGRIPGTTTTDFGAPGARGPWDDEPLDEDDAQRLADLLEACWRAFDATAADAPAELRKGPRGGGRDRDAIVAHVREAERSYGRKIGARVPPRTPWAPQRVALAGALRTGAPDGTWRVRYAARRFAWHVTDHAWEIEDRSTRGRSAGPGRLAACQDQLWPPVPPPIPHLSTSGSTPAARSPGGRPAGSPTSDSGAASR